VGRSSNHHYVPRWYLKHFGSGKKFHLYVFDKQTDAVFRATPGSVASEIGFYDFPDPESGFQFEKAFNKIETPSAHIMKRLIPERTVQSLSIGDKNTIALFIALQILRVKERREELAYMDRKISEMIVARGGDPYSVKGYSRLSAGELRLESIRFLRTAPALVPCLVDKDWLLLQPPAGISYYASDNPVTRYNTINQDPRYGTLGLASTGIEIYLPLTPRLCLALYCPTIKELFPRESPLGHALHNGSCATAPLDSVTHSNSLQVAYATRFVFSIKPQFDLVKTMVRDNPAFRTGARPQIG
jgi:hypothetical protein